jgi:carbon-monoxide dehydrogenase small subunit
MNRRVAATINGQQYDEDVPLRMLLVDFIRDVAGLTGTHVACAWEGRCGACTVLVNGEAVKSCMMLAVQADGSSITTVEGLAADGRLHPLQEAFRERNAIQCGFCTSGILMTAMDLLAENRAPTEEEIRRGLVGNLCRCTGYVHIVEAVQAAARVMRAVPTA